jgi:hypothetical protein
MLRWPGSSFGHCDPLFARAASWRWRTSRFGSNSQCGRRASRGQLLSVEESTATRSARDRGGTPRPDSADEPRHPLWGTPRIHGELQKLGLTVSPATVSKYMLRPRRPPSQAWRAFLRHHAKDLIALDFFTVPTATFRILCALVVLSHDRRRLVHFKVTEHPTAGWTARQLVEACGLEETPRYLIRDRDQVYGERFSCQARTLDIGEAGHRATLALAKRLCRARDWNDSTGMS